MGQRRAARARARMSARKLRSRHASAATTNDTAALDHSSHLAFFIRAVIRLGLWVSPLPNSERERVIRSPLPRPRIAAELDLWRPDTTRSRSEFGNGIRSPLSRPRIAAELDLWRSFERPPLKSSHARRHAAGSKGWHLRRFPTTRFRRVWQTGSFERTRTTATKVDLPLLTGAKPQGRCQRCPQQMRVLFAGPRLMSFDDSEVHWGRAAFPRRGSASICSQCADASGIAPVLIPPGPAAAQPAFPRPCIAPRAQKDDPDKCRRKHGSEQAGESDLY